MDLAVLERVAGIDPMSILLGDGSGGFARVTRIAVDSDPSFVAIADFNRDGAPDAVTANFASDTVAAFLGNGLGGFHTAPVFDAGAVNAVLATDLDGDGHADLALVDSAAGVVIVLRSDGQSGFLQSETFDVGAEPREIAIGRFNEDSVPDLVVATFDGSLCTLLGEVADDTRTSGHEFQVACEPDLVDDPTGIGVADFNGDGLDDLVITRADDVGNSAVVLKAEGSGRFSLVRALAIEDRSSSRVAIGRFDEHPRTVRRASPPLHTGPFPVHAERRSCPASARRAARDGSAARADARRLPLSRTLLRGPARVRGRTDPDRTARWQRAALRRPGRAMRAGAAEVPLLSARGLCKNYPLRGPFGADRGTLAALRGVSFDLKRGEIVGLAGESGCGKSTLARCLMGLERPDAGTVVFRGVEPALLGRGERRRHRRRLQMIFQDPYASLNPRMKVGAIVGEPLRAHGLAGGAELVARVGRLLDRVGLGAQAAGAYPHAFSGGQRQRIGIARALALAPELIVADEPVSALDLSVQAQILNLLLELAREDGLGLLIISHDLAVLRQICDRLLVMYLGEIVESAPADALFSSPGHPYTQALLAAQPNSDPSAPRDRAQKLEGDPPSGVEIPSGCPFHPRCPRRLERCSQEIPPLRELEAHQSLRCWL